MCLFQLLTLAKQIPSIRLLTVFVYNYSSLRYDNATQNATCQLMQNKYIFISIISVLIWHKQYMISGSDASLFKPEQQPSRPAVAP